ncbi:type II toxin-antitoxin system death-on-curing family toxin [Maricaulis maris]|uniref:Death-on-curing protein n=1 Tax=Maricaulis maris TaxID=74318 RepID=A0A495D153_9PROT|nr:type II toxin-antitoxin system death-on-curing family toxin [Maricaulis maris]RKQ95234.1 death-on-curing protein [Maricaulis maris]
MSAPKWLSPAVVFAVHDMQIAEHGGAAGLRDAEGLDSSLVRPSQAYESGLTDLHALAAKYAHGLASAHPFVDGNKRTAFLAAFIFLGINGLNLTASEIDVVRHTLALAAGKCLQGEYAEWLRMWTKPVDLANAPAP